MSTKTTTMKYRGVTMYPTLAKAEYSAAMYGAGHTATQVYEGDATGYGVMRLRDRAVFGVGGKMVPGSAW
jgi:hypothetical protein